MADNGFNFFHDYSSALAVSLGSYVLSPIHVAWHCTPGTDSGQRGKRRLVGDQSELGANPLGFWNIGSLVRHAAEDKQQIAESIQVDHEVFGNVGFVVSHEGHHAPFGTTTHRASEVQLRCSGRPRRQNEVLQRR